MSESPDSIPDAGDEFTQPPAPKPDTQWKPGSIKSLKLVNFMCHESFKLDFGPGVNFIIGPNGSGKSALLTAIVVALGGRASITSRGKRTNEFVAYNKNSAKVTLVLHNYDRISDKERAFKPDDYGKFIIIEKTIHKDDKSFLALKNDREKKVSERKQELDEILDHFNIQINNPICILNQEVSKTFLHSKKPEDKFQLFMKATNLEQIGINYNEATEAHSEWGQSNESKKSGFHQLDLEFESCSERITLLTNRFRLNETCSLLKKELLWAKVRDREVECKGFENALEDIKEDMSKTKSKMECKKLKIKQSDEEVETTKIDATSLGQRISEEQEKSRQLRAKEIDAKKEQIDINQRVSGKKATISRLQKDKSILDKKILDLRRSLNDQNALDQDSETRKTEIENLERDLINDRAREKTISSHIKQLELSVNHKKQDLHAAASTVANIKNEISTCRARLARQKAGIDDAVRRYGDHMGQLRSLIEKESRFKHKPLGPLGLYLKLKSKDVAAPLEVHLGKNAYAFVCDNQSDRQILVQLCRRLNGDNSFRQPLMILRPFTKRHNVSQYKARHETYKTLLDYIDVKEDAIFNALVDRCSPECVLYIPDYEDAENLMLNAAPTHTKSAYTKDCTVMYPRTAHAGYRSHSNKGQHRTLFAENNQSYIREIEAEIQSHEADLRNKEHVHQNIMAEYKAQKDEFDASSNELKKIAEDIRVRETRLLDLKTQITHEPQELSVYEDELNEKAAHIEREKVELEKLSEKLAGVEQELKTIASRRSERQSLIAKLELDREAKSKIIEELKASIKDCEDDIVKRQVHVKRLEEEKTNLTRQLEDKLQTLNLLKSSSGVGCGDKPDRVRKTSIVEEEVRKIESQIRVEAEDERDPDEVIASLKKRQLEIAEVRGLKEKNLQNFDNTTSALGDRRAGLCELRRYTTSATSSSFTSVMRSMNMKGELKIYLTDEVHRGEVLHKAGTLQMNIETNYARPSQRETPLSAANRVEVASRSRSQPASVDVEPPRSKRPRTCVTNALNTSGEKENGQSSSSSRMTDTRSLSGGERSFSTVAFVLALWYHCTSPFKLMDEVDVFMDMITRRMCYHELIRYSQGHGVDSQYFFLSPLELPNIDNSEGHVKVFEMPTIVRKRPHSQV